MFSSQTLYTYIEANPIVLYLYTKRLIPDFEHWDTEVIAMEIKRLTNQDITRTNLNKLMAAKTCIISDSPWFYWEVFNNIILGLNGYPPSLEALHIPALHELWFGLEMMKKLKDEKFNEKHSEIPKYVAAIFLHENVHYAPEPFSFSQLYISGLTYTCKKCGQKGNAIETFDGDCGACHSKELTIEMNYDSNQQKELYEKFIKEESPTVLEEANNIAAGKLLLAKKYVDLKLNELKEQMNILHL